MDENTQNRYRSLLLDLKAELEAELRQSADDEGSEAQTVNLDGSMGRVSRGDAMQVQQLALEMNRRREQRLQRIESALKRITEGTYGQCVRCAKPIAPERLETFPDVVLCVRCAG